MFSLNATADIISAWYSWGVAIAFAISFVTTLWIFFDSQSNGYGASMWRWISLLAAIVVIPSVILSFTPQLAAGLPAAVTNGLAVLGMIATLVSLLTLLLYGLGVHVDMADQPATSDVTPVPLFDDEESGPMIPSAPTPTPPHGVQPTTKEKPLTPPQRITPTDSDTIRIKSAMENGLPLAWIVILNGPHAGQEYRLQKITDIGREKEHNDVALEDPTISRQHARIRYEKGAFVIYDLASANGVFVNGEQVSRRVLTHGDRIKLGQIMLGMLMVDETRPAPEEPTAGELAADEQPADATPAETDDKSS
jgi:hypothetical protein